MGRGAAWLLTKRQIICALSLFFCIGASVMVTINLSTKMGLGNGSMGF